MRLWINLVSAIFLSIGLAHSSFADAVEEAMNADRAFSQFAQDKGVAEAFATFAADNALRFAPGEPNRGPAAIKAAVAKDFAKGGRLSWEPKEGLASADGNQVVVWGRWVFHAPKDAQGREARSYGTYLTVWVKQKDGKWKWTHDIGNSDPKPAAP